MTGCRLFEASVWACMASAFLETVCGGQSVALSIGVAKLEGRYLRFAMYKNASIPTTAPTSFSNWTPSIKISRLHVTIPCFITPADLGRLLLITPHFLRCSRSSDLQLSSSTCRQSAARIRGLTMNFVPDRRGDNSVVRCV